MTDSMQISAASAAAAPRPVAKRANDTTQGATQAPSDVKPSKQTHIEKPVEPVVKAEPSTRLTITRDEAANTFVYRSINAETGEVVWQYPVEQVLRMAHRLRELEGLDSHVVDETI
ncbi:MAG: hypothetical protein GC190_05725 [Alphaproteobacteria bacterium]|nr:hypothetical protein [Alphaproteobacteria bacterium]